MGTFKGGGKLKVGGILFHEVTLKLWHLLPSLAKDDHTSTVAMEKGSTLFIFFLGLISMKCFPCFICLRMNQGDLLCECSYLRKYFLKKFWVTPPTLPNWPGGNHVIECAVFEKLS